MKKCNKCGTQADDQAAFCATCGSSDMSKIETLNGQPIHADTNPFPPVVPTLNAPTAPTPPVDNGHGNILAGIIGALLFSLAGAVLYFVVYQMGFIAGICGLVMFVLADFGYGLFAQTKNKTSLVRLAVSFLSMAVMIFAAEYLCLSYEIFSVFEGSIAFFEAVQLTPDFLSDPEISGAVIEDLIFAYGFGILATFGNISQVFKARKQKS